MLRARISKTRSGSLIAICTTLSWSAMLSRRRPSWLSADALFSSASATIGSRLSRSAIANDRSAAAIAGSALPARM